MTHESPHIDDDNDDDLAELRRLHKDRLERMEPRYPLDMMLEELLRTGAAAADQESDVDSQLDEECTDDKIPDQITSHQEDLSDTLRIHERLHDLLRQAGIEPPTEE